MDEQLHIFSQNCRGGLSVANKRRDLFQYVRNKKYNIICLQDVHINKQLEPFIKSEWGYDVFFSSFTNSSRGVMILINNNFEFKVEGVKTDKNGNYILLDITIQGKRITLVNIYGPNEDNPNFYTNIIQKISEFENDQVIICGDWNFVLDPDLDYNNYLHVNNPRARKIMLDFIEKENFVDAWRVINENCRKYTWRRLNPTIKQARLDYFLVSENMSQYVVDAEIIPGYRTDHSGITLKLKLLESERGKGYWKFNNTLLKDNEYVTLIKNTIEDVKKTYVNNGNDVNIANDEIQFNITDQLFLETLLMMIRGNTIKYSSEKKKKRVKEENALEEDIKRLENEICLNGINVNNQTVVNLVQKQNELVNLRNEKIEGVMLRSKCRYMDLGEKPTNYFFSLETRNYTSKVINKLIEEDIEYTKTKDVLNCQKQFYEKLYDNVNEINDDTPIENITGENETKLSDAEAETIEGEITYAELAKALKNMKNEKSPGLDGYTVEFFKFFWIDIGVFVLRSINYGYRTGLLSVTQKQGIITCLPKPNKCRYNLKNWRPISLLNVVYKMASAAIANRLKLTLDNLIHETQKGFISGRFIGENIRLIYDVLFEQKIETFRALFYQLTLKKLLTLSPGNL